MRRRDEGYSLVELVVAMVIVVVFLALVATVTLSLTRSVRRGAASVDAQAATRTAFQQFDKQIRYADAVTAPGPAGGSQWIEWQVADPSIPVLQSITQRRCYQWRATASTGQLQVRSWIVPTTGPVTTPAWRTIASDLVIGTQPVFTTDPSALAAAPFDAPAPATGALPYSRVGVSLSAADGSPAGKSSISTVFAALNSSAVSTAACGQVARA